MTWIVTLGSVAAAAYPVVAGVVYLLGSSPWRRGTRMVWSLSFVTAAEAVALLIRAATKLAWDGHYDEDLALWRAWLTAVVALPCVLVAHIFAASAVLGPKGIYEDGYRLRSLLAALAVMAVAPLLGMTVVDMGGA
jgi:hypothetical protein